MKALFSIDEFVHSAKHTFYVPLSLINHMRKCNTCLATLPQYSGIVSLWILLFTTHFIENDLQLVESLDISLISQW